MPLHTTLRQPLRLPTTKMNRDPARCLIDVLEALEGVHATENKNHHHISSFRVEGKENSWSRSARRKRKMRKEAEVQSTDNDQKNSTPALVCDVHIIWNEVDIHSKSRTSVEVEWTGLEVGEDEGNGTFGAGAEDLKLQEDPGYSLECQWIFGTDRTVFETLAGHVGRKLIECIQT